MLIKQTKIGIFFRKKFSLYFEIELSNPKSERRNTIKNFLYFSEKKYFLYFEMTVDQAVK